MINFRYHVVSLTAVFLALVIGIAMGTTVVSKATVDGLRSNLSRAEARSSSVNATNHELTGNLKVLRDNNTAVDNALDEQVLAPAVKDELTDVPVLVLASKGIKAEVLERSLAALDAAGAKVDGTLVIDDRLALEGDDPTRLAQVLQVDPNSNVRRIVLSRLASVLASAASMPGVSGATSTTSTSTPSGPTTSEGAPTTSGAPPANPAAPQEPELVTALRAGGFLEFRPVAGGSSSDKVLQGSGYRYLVLSGADPNVANADFIDPLIADMAALGPVPLVAASAPVTDVGTGRDAFIGPLLDLPNVKGNISTVDDLEQFSGFVGVVYAMAELDRGRHGNYGLGADATAVLPAAS